MNTEINLNDIKKTTVNLDDVLYVSNDLLDTNNLIIETINKKIYVKFNLESTKLNTFNKIIGMINFIPIYNKNRTILNIDHVETCGILRDVYVYALNIRIANTKKRIRFSYLDYSKIRKAYARIKNNLI